MSKRRGITDEERANLVAYLDGELTREQSRIVEKIIALDPEVRAEVEALKRTWELLDFLPRPEPSVNFTENTLSKLRPIRKDDLLKRQAARRLWRRVFIGVGWAAALVVAMFGGYWSYKGLNPRPEPGENELVRDLRVIENKRYYDRADNLEFVKELAKPDLFGDEGH